ncbi:MAG: S41 family peptidase [Rhodopseudomonas palustris]|nr:S41 family peptidase [Rhodopseudomonas palustris]
MARAEIIDPKIGYLRLADVEQAAVAELDAELAKFAAARVTGYVLDLRFAERHQLRRRCRAGGAGSCARVRNCS